MLLFWECSIAFGSGLRSWAVFCAISTSRKWTKLRLVPMSHMSAHLRHIRSQGHSKPQPWPPFIQVHISVPPAGSFYNMQALVPSFKSFLLYCPFDTSEQSHFEMMTAGRGSVRSAQSSHPPDSRYWKSSSAFPSTALLEHLSFLVLFSSIL